MLRIAIIGCSGAGKSTFSRRLGEVLGRPVTHLDAIYWQPGWKKPDRPQWVERNRQMVTATDWIIDGNYGSTLDIRLDAADTVVFLDAPRWRCIWGFLYRCYFDRGHPDLPAGCPEPLLPRKDMRDHVRYLWNYPKNQRPRTLEKLERLRPDKRIVILNSRRDADLFLRKLSPPSN